MSLGAAMAGGNPKEGRAENDFYPTPWECTRALLNAEVFDGIIHEPACGDGAISKMLEADGFTVKSSDLNPQGYGVKRDFFTITRPVAHNIVTNPPFNLAEKFIRHSMSLHPLKVAFLLKSTYWHAKTRKSLFDQFRPRHIYPFLWRPDFQGLGRPTMDCMWVVWHRGYKGYPDFIPLEKPLENLAISAM